MSDDLSKVDWGRPIEAVHEDGTVVPMRFDRKIWDQGVWLWQTTWHPADNSNENWEEDGADCVPNSGWRIRNVAEAPLNPETPSDDIAKRMEALVREAVDSPDRLLADKARAIVALLPEPVDADLVEARRIAAGLYDIPDNGKDDKTMIALAAIRRGRALERDSR